MSDSLADLLTYIHTNNTGVTLIIWFNMYLYLCKYWMDGHMQIVNAHIHIHHAPNDYINHKVRKIKIRLRTTHATENCKKTL